MNCKNCEHRKRKMVMSGRHPQYNYDCALAGKRIATRVDVDRISDLKQLENSPSWCPLKIENNGKQM